METDEVITLCCLLWAVPGQEAAMTAYEDDVLRFVGPSGGEVIERVLGDGRDGSPHEVQVYRFSTQAALDVYLQDPRRLALAEIRDRVVARTQLFPVRGR